MKSSGLFILLIGSSLLAQEMSRMPAQESILRLPAQEVSQGTATAPSVSHSNPNATAEAAPEATAAITNSDIFLVCVRGKENRWLRAFKLDSGRCKTHYSKEGYVQVVSSASYFVSCEAVMNSVRKNIEEGGFKCQEKNLESMVELE